MNSRLLICAALLMFSVPLTRLAQAAEALQGGIACSAQYGRTFLAMDRSSLKVGNFAVSVEGSDQLNPIFDSNSSPLEFESQLTDVALQVPAENLQCRHDSPLVLSCIGVPGIVSLRVRPYWAPWRTEAVQMNSFYLQTSRSSLQGAVGERLDVVVESEIVLQGHAVRLKWKQSFHIAGAPSPECFAD